jgi:FMN-dependent NADH-azoreductase
MILYVNACVRKESRTKRLADRLLEKLNGAVEEVRLDSISFPTVDRDFLIHRDELIAAGDFDNPLFALARQFAASDVIVVAAPYYDLSFPASLKQYLEQINVVGLTFRYSPQGKPQSLCRAKALHYVTTAGGFIGQNDFGFSYIKTLAQNFFGINEIYRYTAEGLDIFGADADAIMRKAKAEIIAGSQNYTIPYPAKYGDPDRKQGVT